jgi:hypothetical protein
MPLLWFRRIRLIAMPAAWSFSSDGDLLLLRFFGGIFGENSLQWFFLSTATQGILAFQREPLNLEQCSKKSQAVSRPHVYNDTSRQFEGRRCDERRVSEQ